MRNALLISLLIAMALSTSGCATLLVGAAAGATSVMYLNGAAESTVDASIEKTGIACEKAFKELQIAITTPEGKTDKLTRTLVGRTQNDEKVKVYLKAITDSSTKVNVRIGIFGDKDMSSRIHAEIRKQLGIS